LFLFLGFNLWQFQVSVLQIIILFLSGILSSFALGFKGSRLKSTVITCLGLALLLRTDFLLIWALAPLLALLSKKILRLADYSIFNPANFALIFLHMLLPQYVWVSSGQWSQAIYYILAMIVMGIWVTRKVSTLTISLSYLCFLIAFKAVQILYIYGDSFEIFQNHLSQASLYLFAFFMISDPRTSATTWPTQVIYSFILALLTFIGIYEGANPYAPFYALFVLSLVFNLYRALNKDDVFIWHDSLVKK